MTTLHAEMEAPYNDKHNSITRECSKGAVRLDSTVMVHVGEILKILNLAKFQSMFENTPLFFEIFD